MKKEKNFSFPSNSLFTISKCLHMIIVKTSLYCYILQELQNGHYNVSETVLYITFFFFYLLKIIDLQLANWRSRTVILKAIYDISECIANIYTWIRNFEARVAAAPFTDYPFSLRITYYLLYSNMEHFFIIQPEARLFVFRNQKIVASDCLTKKRQCCRIIQLYKSLTKIGYIYIYLLLYITI